MTTELRGDGSAGLAPSEPLLDPGDESGASGHVNQDATRQAGAQAITLDIVWEKTAMAKDAPATSLPIRRLHALVEQVYEEAGRANNRTAQRLGLGETQISKIRGATRGGSLDTIVTVIGHMRIAPDYFFDPTLGEAPPYRQFLRHGAPAKPQDSEHWRRFLMSDEAKALTPEQLEWVRAAPFRGGARSYVDYIHAAEVIVRGDLSPPAGFDEAPTPKGKIDIGDR